METDSREFGLFIDGLRLERNMSREDLCDEIISLSQYKRYLRGDSSIPNIKLVQIADKLKFSISDIHLLFQNRSDNQLSKINVVYGLIQSRKFQEAYQFAMKLKDIIFVSTYNKLFFDFCMVYIQHNLNMVSDVHVLELYSKMINYPECQSNESFNWVEMNILFQIIKTSSKIKNYEPANLMYKMLTDKNYNFSFSKDSSLLPNIYLTIGQILGQQERYEEVIEITNNGISHCIKYEISFALASLFFINSYALYDLGRIEEAIESAKKVFMQLYIENKVTKYQEYKKLFEAKFQMDLDKIICI